MPTQHVQRVVLLVRHDDDSREMYTEFLAHEGFSILAVDDGDDAFKVATQADVIVTGIRLRGTTDGVGLIDRLRGDGRTKHTPIIMLAADAFPKDRERAASAGCDVFLAMPCRPDELLRAIRRMLLRQVRGRTAKADHPARLNVSARNRQRKG